MTPRLHEYAAASAARTPGATAVVLGEDRLSYARLIGDARRLARLLEGVGVEPADRVALLVAKSPAAVVGMHAALELGAAYVPIDLASPPPRAARILRSAEPRAMLADAAATKLLDGLGREGELPEIPLVSLAPDWPGGEREAAHGPDDWAGLADEPLGFAGGPDAVAHILFTSGSTGDPKGVQITHGMVGAFVDWALAHFETAPGERISGHPPLHFDLSTFDIYATLKAGAELHLVPASASLTPKGLADFIRDSDLNQWFSVPSTLAFMVRAGVIGEGDFPALSRVLFCGEAMPKPVLREWMARVPHARYTNLYGPTETTIASSYYDVTATPDEDTGTVPIGFPCGGEELLLLDESHQTVPRGEVGQIFIAGAGLSPGYWRDAARTREAFIADPRGNGRIYATGDLGRADEAGCFHFVGRVDSQVKHRGYRIELGEIESALNGISALRECAVVAVPTSGFEGTVICGAYASDGPELSPVDLRATLAGSLPTYMLPSRWRAFDALPKNANGKIDRRALRDLFANEVG